MIGRAGDSGYGQASDYQGDGGHQAAADGALLVSESDSGSDPLFQRPLGGHVEFGEYALDTVRREFGEEIGQELTDVRLLGVLENIFGWRGGTEHEVVFIFAAAFASAAAYEIEEQRIRDNPDRRVLWRPATRSARRCTRPGCRS